MGLYDLHSSLFFPSFGITDTKASFQDWDGGWGQFLLTKYN